MPSNAGELVGTRFCQRACNGAFPTTARRIQVVDVQEEHRAVRKTDSQEHATHVGLVLPEPEFGRVGGVADDVFGHLGRVCAGGVLVEAIRGRDDLDRPRIGEGGPYSIARFDVFFVRPQRNAGKDWEHRAKSLLVFGSPFGIGCVVDRDDTAVGRADRVEVALGCRSVVGVRARRNERRDRHRRRRCARDNDGGIGRRGSRWAKLEAMNHRLIRVGDQQDIITKPGHSFHQAAINPEGDRCRAGRGSVVTVDAGHRGRHRFDEAAGAIFEVLGADAVVVGLV